MRVYVGENSEFLRTVFQQLALVGRPCWAVSAWIQLAQQPAEPLGMPRNRVKQTEVTPIDGVVTGTLDRARQPPHDDAMSRQAVQQHNHRTTRGGAVDEGCFMASNYEPETAAREACNRESAIQSSRV